MNSSMRTFLFSMALFASVFAAIIFMNLERGYESEVVVTKTRPVAELSPNQLQRVRDFTETWPAEPALEQHFNALDPEYDVASLTNSLFDPADDYWGLPRDSAGSYELVDAYCGGCHSLSIVMQQRATPARWDELLIWMEDKQGMAPLSPEYRTDILAYLSDNFSSP